MTKEDLKQWQIMMGYEDKHAIDALGCTPQQWRAWTSGEKIPRYIALATSALALDISPNGDSDYGDSGKGK